MGSPSSTRKAISAAAKTFLAAQARKKAERLDDEARRELEDQDAAEAARQFAAAAKPRPDAGPHPLDAIVAAVREAASERRDVIGLPHPALALVRLHAKVTVYAAERVVDALLRIAKAEAASG